MRILRLLVVFMLSLQTLLLPCINAEVLAAATTTATDAVPVAGYNPLNGPNYPMSQDSYFTDDVGNILMIINVVGDVGSPGQIVVRESADFATVLTRVGGPRSTANLKKVVLARNKPDKDGTQTYKINLKPFYEEGDRSAFIALKPNDTIIVPEKKGFNLESITAIAALIISGYTVYRIFKP